MSTAKAKSESPLVDCVISQSHQRQNRSVGVVFEELELQTHVNLRCQLTDESIQKWVDQVLGVALPTQPNMFVQKQELRVFWLAPDEWLIVTPQAESDLVEKLDSVLEGVHHAVTPLTGGQTVIRITGPTAREVLAQGCTLDLHQTVFGPNYSAQTLLAHVPVLICLVNGMNREDSIFDVVVRRSFADYLARWLVDGAVEYGFRCTFSNAIKPKTFDIDSDVGTR